MGGTDKLHTYTFIYALVAGPQMDSPCIGVNCGEGGCLILNDKPICICVPSTSHSGKPFDYEDPTTWQKPDKNLYCNDELYDSKWGNSSVEHLSFLRYTFLSDYLTDLKLHRTK